MSFDERQRLRRAAGKTGTAELLAGLEATNPHLREYAEWLLAAPRALPPVGDPLAAVAEIRDTIGALRLVNAKREATELGRVISDDPHHPDTRRRRERIAEILRYVREVERSGAVRPRPWQQIVDREENPPPRMLRPVCPVCKGAGELRGPGPMGRTVRCWVCRP